jgi:hypothetical protein
MARADCDITCHATEGEQMMAEGFQKGSSLMQAAVLGHPKQFLMETKMSVRALTPVNSTRERSGFWLSALPVLVSRTDELRKAFLAQILAILVHRLDKHGRIFVAQIMAALKEARRREAVRIIHRYRHLVHNDEDNV